MNVPDKQKLKVLIAVMAEYYKCPLSDHALLMYVEDLEDLPLHEVERAAKELRRDPRTTRLPLPAAIRAHLMPPKSDTVEANAAANRIWSAIAKFGYPNPDKARAYIGTLGWEVVMARGGWNSVCQESNDNSNLQVQLQRLAETVITRTKAGLGDQAPELPTPAGLTLLQDRTQEIAK